MESRSCKQEERYIYELNPALHGHIYEFRSLVDTRKTRLSCDQDSDVHDSILKNSLLMEFGEQRESCDSGFYKSCSISSQDCQKEFKPTSFIYDDQRYAYRHLRNTLQSTRFPLSSQPLKSMQCRGSRKSKESKKSSKSNQSRCMHPRKNTNCRSKMPLLKGQTFPEQKASSYIQELDQNNNVCLESIHSLHRTLESKTSLDPYGPNERDVYLNDSGLHGNYAYYDPIQSIQSEQRTQEPKRTTVTLQARYCVAKESCDDIEVSPPSYESIYIRAKHEREISNGRLHFFKRVMTMLYNSYAWFVLLVLLAVLAAAIAVFGALNIDNCRLEPLIPVYLIGFGVACFCKLLLFAGKIIRKEDSNLIGEKQPTRIADWCRFFQLLFTLFLIAWFILGNVWVYRLYKNFYYLHSDHYNLDCDKTVYLVAFWIVNSTYAIIMSSCTFYWLCSCIMGTL